MGFRVEEHKRKNSPGKIPKNPFVQILSFTRLFLEAIGRPFYHLITWAFVLLFTLAWLLGKLIFTLKLTHPTLSVSIPHFNFFRPLWIKLCIILIIFGTLITSAWTIVLKDLPKPGTLLTRDQALTTKIYDRNGTLLYKIYRNQNRTLIPLDIIPEHAKNATIAIEDSGFYSHPGFSVRGILRSFWHNSTRGQLTGGSTITQQLVKNTLLTPEKTLLRKVKEIVLSIQVEMSFSKDEILEMYLNEVSYGGEYYGIEEAAVGYFGKSARDLNLSESAILAGLPKAPTTFSPFGVNPEKTRSRQLEVLAQMVEQSLITGGEADTAARTEVVFAPQRTDIKAPHFVMYVKQYLAEKYGEDLLEKGGLEVYTSLDLELQEKAQEIVRAEVEKIRKMNISNGASLVTNPATGEILAMVGSYDYWDMSRDGNVNVALALRQPGSSIKPVNYAYALETRKYTPASVITDTPITYHVAGSPPYTPHNYNNSYRGNVTLRTALGSSLNVPAVKVLASVGVDKMIYQGQKMGITSWNDPRRFGLSLTLGGGEVKMTDMNVVYATLANYGRRVDLNPVLYATDYRGRVLEQNLCASQGQTVERPTRNIIPRASAAEASFEEGCGQEVLDSRVAYILTDVLRDNGARTPTFGPRSLLVIPDHAEVAVKTGTTQNLRDNWTIGYTQDYVVAAWVGNNDNSPMSYVASGITGATPIWHNTMAYLLEGKSNHPWPEPKDLVKLTICPTTGTLPCVGCGGKIEYFIPGTEPKNRCVPKTEDSPTLPLPAR